ncbi:MAG: hypothetical protein K2H01_01070 [Ruminococcus sp.]|nr:hypothetical protein [Ruminococcus sp.]
MNKSELFYKMKKNGVAPNDFEFLSEGEYHDASARYEKDIYQTRSGGTDYYFRTKGADKDTFLEIQFQIYKCLKTIKNVVIIAFIAAMATGVISFFAFL